MFTHTTAVTKIIGLKKRIRVIQGGSSAGKTVGIVAYLIARAQSDKTPTLTSIVSESLPHLKRGAMLDFLNIMQQHGYFKDERWNKSDFVYEFENHSKIEFFSIDQPRKVRGPRRHRLFINEANNTPFESYEQLEIRTEELIIIDYNPTSEFWAHEHLIGKRPDTDFLILTYKDNEVLSPAIVASLESRQHRKEWWKVYGLGQLGDVEGRIYSDWSIIDDIPHEARLERYGLDFGYSQDPTAIVAIYYHNGGYILDEIAYQKGMLNKHIADTFLNLPVKGLVIADSAEPKSIDEIKLHDVNILPCEKGADSVRNGIALVQAERISVTRRSVNLIREYRNYLWAVDRNGNVISPNVPEAGEDHCMDALRYAMTSIRRPEVVGKMSVFRPGAKNGAIVSARVSMSVRRRF